MGVLCHLIQISERKLMDLDEAIVPDLFYQAIHSRYNSLSHLLASAAAPELPIVALDLEKRWWLLNFFFTGKAEELVKTSPVSRAILGGTAIGRELQQGPARYLWADEVHEIAAALSALSHQELWDRFDDPAGFMRTGYEKLMAGYFCAEFLDDAVFNGLVADFDLLATYYRVASARRNAMLLGLT
jgi:hypothetical protein